MSQCDFNLLFPLYSSLSRSPLDAASVARMQTFKTVETQVPFLKESFFTTTFKGRRKSSVTNILRKQQHSLLIQQHQQQQCILEHQQQRPKQFLPQSVENGQGQFTPEHRRLARSTSSPLCKTAERAGADGDGEEGQKERKDQRVGEAVQGRGGERGVSGSKPAAVSASLLLLSSSASAALGEAASSSQLPLTVVGRQQGLGSSERALTSRGPASVADQEGAQHAQPRPQQPGLLAKGVRLLRNMGNQETKQKKGGGSGRAAGDVSCDADADADEREVDKKSKKSHNKISKGGGGEHNGKKKSKSESKGSVFSGMKIRKSLSKVKGLSKEDMLEDGRSAHFDKAGLKPAAEASLSADEMGMLSDVEGDLSRLTADSHQSIVDEIGRKTSSGSDADLYSFHSAAAENEDLLSDIQQAIRNQCVASDRVLEMVAGHVPEGSTSDGSKAPEKVFNLDEEVFPPPVGSECAPQEASEEKLENESRVITISRNSSGPGSLSDSGPPSSAADTERSSGSLFPKTNSTYSFPDTATTTTSYESAEEPQDDLESPQQSKSTYGTCVRLDPVVAGAGPMGSHKSVSSMDLSIEREGVEETGRRDFLSLKRRKSSLSISQLTPDLHVSQPRRPSSTSPSTVKLYPPVHPSYVKTTTRQLTSPVGSPITSPHVPRKTDVTVASVEPSEAKGFKRHKQRSCSIAGPISVSADWSKELDELTRGQGGGAKFPEQDAPEKSYTSGTYWTLGSRRAHYARKTSSTAVPYLDVFSGESHVTLNHCHT